MLFNDWPYTNLHNLNLDWILSKIKGSQAEFKAQFDDLNNKYNALTKKVDAIPAGVANSFLTPEMFGAKGDGVTDDTAALQAAFDAATTSKKTLYSFGVTYYVTDTINVNGPVHCDFGYSYLKCPGSMQTPVIDYDSKGYASSFNAICFDGSDSPATMMKISRSNNTFITNVYSIHCKNFIDVVTGYEVTLSKALLFNGDGTLGNIAVKCQSFDCHFNEVYAVNYQTIFDMLGGNNRIGFCHCWNTSSSSWNNTKFADIKADYNIFTACTTDTFDISFNVANGKLLFVYDLLAYHDNKPNCVLFAGDTTKVYINGIQGNGRKINKLCDGQFSGRLTGLTLTDYIDVPAKTSYYVEVTPVNGATIDSNRMYIEDDTVTVEIHGSISFSGNTKGYVDVAKIPAPFYPISYTYHAGYLGVAYAAANTNMFAISGASEIRFYTNDESGVKSFALTATVKVKRD